ncbi:polysaccharide biosynthesis PFTS motif protein [Flavobacteriaceae bacterium]|nr:polysaccharide biosynthesis PFTS motif protein [Flavobacteriaceae bacterium]
MYRWLLNKIKLHKRAKIRAYMRGYIHLKKNDNLEFIACVKNTMANSPISNTDLSELSSDPESICLHQFLVYRLLNNEFNMALQTALMHPHKEIYYPLPSKWRLILEKEGIKANTFYNRVVWFQFQIKWYLFGVATLLIECWRMIKPFRLPKGDYVYFENLTKNNLPPKKGWSSQNNIIEWFLSRPEAKKPLAIRHSAKGVSSFVFKNKNIDFVVTALPPVSGFISSIKFVFWGIQHTARAIFSRNKRLLFRELIFEQQISLIPYEKLARAYYFHNSGHLLRPLWTYSAQERGVGIYFYFYSTNIYSFDVKGKTFLQDHQWQIVSWPNYLVWNETQKRFLEKTTLIKKDIEIVGIIPFNSNNKSLIQENSSNTIIVFDVQPMRTSVYQSLGIGYEYYTSKNGSDFLMHIDQIAKELKLKVIFKRKRNTLNVDKKYLETVKKLFLTARWVEIDPDVDAHLVCEKFKAIASISAPFTSTAMISDSFGIPTIYYDVTEELNEKSSASNKFKMLNNRQDLKDWLTLMKNDR